MVALIQAEEGNFDWSFDSSECLYRDHRGIRVLGDVEGFGYFKFEGSPLGLEILVDGRRLDSNCGSFEESLLISAPGPGPSRLCGMIGRRSPLEVPAEEGFQFVGAGWVVGATSLFEVDGLPGAKRK